MDVSIVAGDLHLALDLLHLRAEEPVLLSFPPGLCEVTVLRHAWETVFFETDAPTVGPPAVTVHGESLRAALDQPMYIRLSVGPDGLQVSDRLVDRSPRALPAPPRRRDLVESAPVALPGSGGPMHRTALLDLPGGGRVQVHSQLAHRFVMRQINTAQVFRCDPHGWAMIGVQIHETHPVAISGLVTVY